MRFASIQPMFTSYSTLAARAGLLLASVALVSACATKTTIDERDSFTHGSTYSHSFTGTSQTACEAGRRTLLGQGYIIDKADPNQISGHKNYQDTENNNQHGQILFNVNCAPSGNGQAIVYANAVRDLYTMKRSSNSASVGLSVLGSVSMPLGSSDDSLVKTSSETISRGAFYEGFFQQVEQNLKSAKAAIDAGVTPAQNSQSGGAAATKPHAAQPASAAPAPSPATRPAPSATPAQTAPTTPSTTQPTPSPAPTTPSTTTQTTPSTPSTSPAAAPATTSSSPATSTTPASAGTTTSGNGSTSSSNSGSSNSATPSSTGTTSSQTPASTTTNSSTTSGTDSTDSTTQTPASTSP